MWTWYTMTMYPLTTGTPRHSSGWLRQRPSKRNIEYLGASGLIDDELWILLEYRSEVEDVGIQFVQQNGIGQRNAKRIFKEFQSYIRQAKNYYYAAKKLHPRSAGLLYYYCFLNLAKSGLVLTEPSIAGRKIGHGLSCMPNDFSKLKKQTVKISNSGVFPKLYEWYFGTSVRSGQSLNLQNLFGYCTDISYQNNVSGFGNTKMLPSFYVVQVDASHNPPIGWPLVGISSFNYCLPYKKSFNQFYKNFEKIELPQMVGRELFEVDSSTLTTHTFFQAKKSINWPIANVPPAYESRDLILDSIKHMLSTNYFGNNSDFYISLPYSRNRQISMDETISIYLIMFYISNLVRYNPRYLEGLLNKREAWLIDSFIRTCPLTFLRSMVSRIVNTDYVISSR